MTAGPFDDLDDYIALPRVSGLAVSADGSTAIVGGRGLREGFAKILDERILAAGNGAEALVRRIGVSLRHVPPVV